MIRPSARNLQTGSSRARSVHAQAESRLGTIEYRVMELGGALLLASNVIMCGGDSEGWWSLHPNVHQRQRTAPIDLRRAMGDEDDETFESTDAGASETYPMEAGQIRKGGHIMIKGNPCKVLDVSTSKTGKHGHAKCHFVAQDIFSGKKMEDLVPASHTTNVPFVKKVELQCMGVDDDGFVSLLTDDGGMREDIKLPNTLNQAPPDAEEVSKRITDFLEKETGASPP